MLEIKEGSPLTEIVSLPVRKESSTSPYSLMMAVMDPGSSAPYRGYHLHLMPDQNMEKCKQFARSNAQESWKLHCSIAFTGMTKKREADDTLSMVYYGVLYGATNTTHQITRVYNCAFTRQPTADGIDMLDIEYDTDPNPRLIELEKGVYCTPRDLADKNKPIAILYGDKAKS